MEELRGFTTVLRAFHEAREELRGHVEEVWLYHDIGSGVSTLGPHVYLDATDDGIDSRANFEKEAWSDGPDDLSNSVAHELAVQTAGAGLQVESAVLAYLDLPGEGIAEGFHELYRNQSLSMDLTSACHEIQDTWRT